MIERAETERFVKALFQQAAEYEGPAFVCSLVNGQGGERKLLTRDIGRLLEHAQRWDVAGRGGYICPNLLRPGERSRKKEAVGLLTTIHADTDFKTIGIDQDEALAHLQALPCPPSMIVATGGGLHCYWLLEDPLAATPNNVELVEGLNGIAADTIGGDTQARDVSRLLRLPGTHNTKYEAWKPVTVVHCDEDRFYDLDTLQDWLTIQSPVIHRITKAKDASTVGEPENPWLAAAKRLGFKPPLDVEKMLDAMSYQGGENGIHETQLRVSAALLGRGVGTDEVVETLLDATRAAAGEFGSRWNWKREEKNLQRMCADWLKKHPEIVERAPVAAQQENEGTQSDAAPFEDADEEDVDEDEDEEPAKANGTNGTGATVVNLSEHRHKKEPATPAKGRKNKKDQHVLIAESLLTVVQERGEKLLFAGPDLWRYQDGLWASDPKMDEAWLRVEIERCCRALSIHSTNSLVSEARGYIHRNPDYFHPSVPWDMHGFVPARNGLFHPETGVIRPFLPTDFATWRLEADYLPEATCPWWLRLLDDLFAPYEPDERAELIQALKEYTGCQIIVGERRRSLRVALGLTGMPNSGKSQITEVFRELIGRLRCASLMFGELNQRFYLEPLTRRRALITDEAIDDKTEIPSGIFKALVTGEPLLVDRKTISMTDLTFTGPIVFTANDWPYAADTTSGFADRLMIIQCPANFAAMEPVGAAAEAFRQGFAKPSELIAAHELPGLINWGLEGWRDAKARGSILIPRRALDIRQRVADASSPVLPFIRECIVQKEDCSFFVQTPAVYAVFKEWYASHYGEHARPYGPKKFWNKVSVNIPRLVIPSQSETRHAGHSIGMGIHLSSAGIEIWQALKMAKLASGASMPTWLSCLEPNFRKELTTARQIAGRSNTNEPDGLDGDPSKIPVKLRKTKGVLF